jgi:hypothetical protein
MRCLQSFSGWLEESKDRDVLDSGLAVFDEYFWQEVAEKFQEVNAMYDKLAFDDPMFALAEIDPSVKIAHTWDRLCDIYKMLLKNYAVVRDNNKRSGNHDDFINFCGNRPDVYYLHLWLQLKPSFENLVVAELPADVFMEIVSMLRRPSPTPSDDLSRRGNKNSLTDAVFALADARKISEATEAARAALLHEKLATQKSINYDDNFKRLLDVK